MKSIATKPGHAALVGMLCIVPFPLLNAILPAKIDQKNN